MFDTAVADQVTVELTVPTSQGAVATVTSLTDLTKAVNDAHAKVQSHAKGMLLEAQRAGEALLKIKEEGKRTGEIPHGQFKAWVEKNCGQYDKFAPYMRVAQIAAVKNVQLHTFEGGIRAFLDTYTSRREADQTPAALPTPPKPAIPEPIAPAPSIRDNAPAADDEGLPWDDGPSTPTAPIVEQDDEEEEDVRKSRGRLRAEDIEVDPETALKRDLTNMLIQIAGGADFGGTTTKHFISSYMKALNPSAVFNAMQSDMTQALGRGDSLPHAKHVAQRNMAEFRATMLKLVNEACDAGERLFAERTKPMDQAAKFLPMAFHISTPPNEAVNAARMALKTMGR